MKHFKGGLTSLSGVEPLPGRLFWGWMGPGHRFWSRVLQGRSFELLSWSPGTSRTSGAWEWELCRERLAALCQRCQERADSLYLQFYQSVSRKGLKSFQGCLQCCMACDVMVKSAFQLIAFQGR